VAVAALFALLSARPDLVGPLPVLAGPLLLAAYVGWIMLQDVRSLTIADGASLGFGVIALTLRIGQAGPVWRDALPFILAQAASVGGLLWLLREAWYRLKGYDGLGLGDVKFALAGALLTGAAGFSLALLLASLIGIGWFVLPVGGIDRSGPRARLPFGALLAPAVLAVYLAGLAGLLPDGFAGGGL